MVRNIPISHPFIGEEEIQAVSETMRSGMIAQGPRVKSFEEKFAHFCGVKHAIATTNGTTALVVALVASGISKGDEVIIPSFSFFATASALLSIGAIPVFADIDPNTFNLDVESVRGCVTSRTKAIMPVHLFGQLANMIAIREFAQQNGLILFEDAAQAHGACICTEETYGVCFCQNHNTSSLPTDFISCRAGSWGVAAAFSFYPTKNMTTSEGGIVTTNDDNIAEKARMIRNHGMNTQYRHEVFGLNYRMTDISASIGLVQLERLPEWTIKRQNNARYYDTHLKGVLSPQVSTGYTHIYHQYTLQVPDGVDRDDVVNRIQAQGVGARIYYPIPIHQQPIVKELGFGEVLLPVTEKITKQVFSIPVHPLLSVDDREYVVQVINEVMS